MNAFQKNLAVLAALLLAGQARAQLQWSSYNTSGALVAANVAAGGDATYGGSVTFTIPAGNEYVFMTRTFAPLNITAPNASNKVNFAMTASGGLYPGSTGRLLGMGLLNDPGTPNNALDDQGFWTDFNTGNPSFEMFYRPNTVANFFVYDSTHKPGSGTTKTGYPTNGVTYGMQFMVNMAASGTQVTIGTSGSTFANCGAGMTNGPGVNQLGDSSAVTLATFNCTTFNEFAVMFNNTTASAVTLTLSGVTLVPANPVIAAQPLGYSGSPGDNTPNTDFAITLNTNTGGPISYQWYAATASATNTLVNGTTAWGSSISGATNAALSFAAAQTNDTASYFVVVSNAYGTATSSPAILNIAAANSAPTISSVAPTAATVVAGQSTNIIVTALGAPTPVFYWYDNNNNLLQSGASPVLTLANVQPANAGIYTVTASNIAGSATSNFSVVVNVTPVITSPATNLLLTLGSPANFSVTATGTPSPSFQWYQNGTALAGTTLNSLSFASVALTNIGTYSVIASNTAGTATNSAVLAIYSSMTGIPSAPANNAAGVCVDTLLAISFSQTPSVGTTGNINIYDASNPSTPVDTLSMGAGNLQLRAIGGVNINAYNILINGSTAMIYPHAGVLAASKTYYVTMDPGVIVDSSGAYFTGLSGSNAWQFTTKPGGAANPLSIMVNGNGSGDFCTVQGAIDSIPAKNNTPTLVNIANGTYTEIDRVNGKSNITFIGQNRAQTVIAYANNNNINGSSTTRPMFGVVSANDIALENLTLTNSTPHGGSQAEALLISTAKRFIALDVTLCSYQDTLLVNESGDQAYVQDSHIQGDTDYIWGSGTLYATNNELMAMSTQSYLTQARTSQNTNGFAFINCRIYGANSSVTNGTLGRDGGSSGSTPSFGYGQAAYVNCMMDLNLIIPAGWTLGSGTTQGPDTANLRFWEYGSVDTNGNLINTSSRVAWSTQITGSVASNQVQNVTNWLSGWQPQLAPAILANPSGLSVAGGGSATLAVSAVGIPAPAYQWMQNGQPLSGQTAATLSIPAAYAGNAGTYSVLVSNIAGNVTSATAVLTVGNTAPALQPISAQTINVGTTLLITNAATDPDVPPQVLTFSLAAGPAVSAVDPVSGIFSWRAPVASGGTTNAATVMVADNGSPSLSASQSFNIVVNPAVAPSMSAPAYASGQLSFTVSGQYGPDYIVQVSSDLARWTSLGTNLSPAVPFTFTDTNATPSVQFYRILLGP